MTAFKDIVLRGVLAPAGMERFDDLLSEQDADNIHAYLIDQTWVAYRAQQADGKHQTTLHLRFRHGPEQRKKRVRHRRARGQFIDEPGKLGRRAPGTRRMTDVVPEESAPKTRAAGGCLPRRQLACKVSIWKQTMSPGSSAQPRIGNAARSASMSGRSVSEPSGNHRAWLVEKAARHEPRPAMRAGDEFQRRLAAHRIHRNPHADVLPALDVVVGLILVPWRPLASARLLGQHVIVIQPHACGCPSAAPRSRPVRTRR